MEFLVVLLIVALLVGLIFRNKGDNTMDTLSKGCGWIILIVIFLLFLFVYQQTKTPN
jgi:vacuolar-type H+-ATPase subunit I/STV1